MFSYAVRTAKKTKLYATVALLVSNFPVTVQGLVISDMNEPGNTPLGLFQDNEKYDGTVSLVCWQG